MFERISFFLPSIAVVGATAVITFLYLRGMSMALGKDKACSIEWIQKHRWMYIVAILLPMKCVFAPTVEELIFRAPIIMGFSKISLGALIAITVSALLFWVGHFLKDRNPITARKLFGIREVPLRVLAGTPPKKVRKDRQKNKRKKYPRITTFVGGWLWGYFGVKYQSLYVSVALHMAVNLFVIIISTILLVILISKRKRQREMSADKTQ